MGTMGPWPPSFRPRRVPPIGFAHRGARAHAPENTLEAFALALRLGATGLESDVWLTADGVPCSTTTASSAGLRRRPIRHGRPRRPARPHPDPRRAVRHPRDRLRALPRREGPGRRCPTVEVALAADPTMASRLWLCDDDHDRWCRWREVAPRPPGRLHPPLPLKEGPERLAAQLRERASMRVNLHHSDWTGGLAPCSTASAACTFGWDAQFDRMLDGLLRMGIDGVYSRPRRSHDRRWPRHLARPVPADRPARLSRRLRPGPTSQVGRLCSRASRSPGPERSGPPPAAGRLGAVVGPLHRPEHADRGGLVGPRREPGQE
jgi:glycerophosphoryl diester phosphodiesterase